MTKRDLIEVLSKKLLRKKDASNIFDFLLNEVKKALKKGEKVSISGFGTFNIKISKSRKMYNPKTKKEIIIEPHRKVRFIPSRKLIEFINNG